jgi:hypothetical protein
MTEAYRAEGDMFVITKRLLDQEVFEAAEVAMRGWAPSAGTHARCRLPLMPVTRKPSAGAGG